MPKEELINEYRSHDIFLMPSITEAFGLVYAEAMSQGLPVIYTKGQGFYGQFPEGCVGYAVDCKDPHDIANKIVKVLNDYKVISKACTEEVDKFAWQRISQDYSNLYHSII